MATNTTYPLKLAPGLDTRELFCGSCGYGIVVRDDPPSCPMCRVFEWRERSVAARWN